MADLLTHQLCSKYDGKNTMNKSIFHLSTFWLFYSTTHLSYYMYNNLLVLQNVISLQVKEHDIQSSFAFFVPLGIHQLHVTLEICCC